MTNHLYNPMNKRGQIIELFGVLIILGITIYGISTIYFQQDNLYVGLKEKSIAFKYTECKDIINNFSQNDIIIFNSLEEVNKKNYEVGECK